MREEQFQNLFAADIAAPQLESGQSGKKGKHESGQASFITRPVKDTQGYQHRARLSRNLSFHGLKQREMGLEEGLASFSYSILFSSCLFKNTNI